MGKRVSHLSVLVAIMVLSLTFVPNVSSQTQNVKVLSYSWYIDSIGFFVAVGEIQNVGTDTIDSVILSGTVYTKDGTPQLYSYTQAFVKYLVPQQKAPFYMEFPRESGDLSWLSLGLDRIDFAVIRANATASYQYPYFAIRDSSAMVTTEGVYWASGTVQNTGVQMARNVRVIGTFYNASGSVVGVGYTDLLSPASLGPSGSASFKVGAFDMNQTEVSSSFKISSYALLIQAEEPVLSGTAPSPTPSSNPTNSSSPSNPADSTQIVTFSPQFLYAVIFVAVILGIAGTALALRKRKSASTKRRKSQSSRKKR